MIEKKAGVLDNEKHLFDFIEKAEMDSILEQLEYGDLSCDPWPQVYPASSVKCYALTTDTGYCIRANNWLGFCEANRVIMKQRTAEGSKPARSEMIKSYVDGLIGQGTFIGEKCNIKRTVIGANCKIGDKVKMHNCILLDNVTVEEGCVLQNSVVCYDVSIGSKAEIKDCIVGPGKKILTLCQYTNESLTEEMLDL